MLTHMRPESSVHHSCSLNGEEHPRQAGHGTRHLLQTNCPIHRAGPKYTAAREFGRGRRRWWPQRRTGVFVHEVLFLSLSPSDRRGGYRLPRPDNSCRPCPAANPVFKFLTILLLAKCCTMYRCSILQITPDRISIHLFLPQQPFVQRQIASFCCFLSFFRWPPFDFSFSHGKHLPPDRGGRPAFPPWTRAVN